MICFIQPEVISWGLYISDCVSVGVDEIGCSKIETDIIIFENFEANNSEEDTEKCDETKEEDHERC